MENRIEIPEHFQSNCAKDIPCRRLNCGQAVKQNRSDRRWYITIGHAGFNSPANNRSGYATELAATGAYRRYNAPSDPVVSLRYDAYRAAVENGSANCPCCGRLMSLGEWEDGRCHDNGGRPE